MTTQEMIQEVFENLAEPTDLEINTTPGDPTTFDITLAGSQLILRYINNALTRVANYQYPDGRILRFNTLYKRVYFTHPAPYTGTAISATNTSILVPGFASNADDDFNGWYISILTGTGAGQKRLVIDSTAVGFNENCTIDRAWDTNPDATSTFEIYKSFVLLLPTGSTGTYTSYHIVLDPNMIADSIIKLVDRKTDSVLGRSWFSDILEGATVKGTPSEWYRHNDRLQFDAAFSEERTYELWYYSQPTALTVATQVPNIPAAFQEAVTLYATHKLRNRAGDFDGQYVDKRNFIELMASLRMPDSMRNESEHNSITVWG